MGRIPEAIIEDVLARTDITQVVGQYVGLKRSGANFKGLCPFHNEKTPSFYVHPGKGIYKCFGCGAGGNAFQFLMGLEGWTFRESVKHLAGRLGIEIPEESEEDAKKARQRQEARDLYTRIMQAARDFYERSLWDDAVGERARSYLVERGVDEQTARTFGLGYAPQGWQNLLDYLAEQRINGALVERAGLALTRRESSGYYDRFRDRIMFPVIDIWGNTMAFGGRVLPGDDGPKYINSSETKFYVKGNHLFGLHAAKKGIQRTGEALLVEGNFDVVLLHASGFDMAVAPMGTSFTDRQAKLLKRYTTKVTVAFDGDKAGASASKRCIPAMEYAGVKAQVIRLDDGEDPDSYVRAHGAQSFQKLIDASTPLLAWAIDDIMPASELEIDVEQRVKVLEDVSKIVTSIKEPIVWKHYADEIARRLDIDQRLLKRYLKRPEQLKEEVENAMVEAGAPASASADDVKLEKEELALLVLLLDHPDWLADFLGEQLDNLLHSAELARLLRMVHEHAQAHEGNFDPALFIARLEEPTLSALMTKVLARAGDGLVYDLVANSEEEKLEEKDAQVYQDTLRMLKLNWAKRSIKQIEDYIAELDYSKDRDALVEAMTQKQQLEKFRIQQEQLGQRLR